MAKKCRQCGLVNWDYQTACLRCKASLNSAIPPVYKWFVVYCIVMALLYMATALMGIGFMFIEPDPEMSAAEAKIMGSAFLILGLVFRSLCVSSILAPQELGLGLWACAHLLRVKQRLLFACMYSAIDILVETRDEGVLR